MPRIAIPYEQHDIELSVPAGIDYQVAVPREVETARDVGAEIRRSITQPLGSPELRELAKPGRKVAIAVTDITRKAFEDTVVPILLGELREAGVRYEDVTLVVATGTHRANTREELIEKLGPSVVDKVRIVNHNAYDKSRLAMLGTTSSGIRVILNKDVAEADLRIATGSVDPHLYAGYSGGAKTISVGCASAETIAGSHNVRVCEDPSVRLGVVEGNVFRALVDEVGSLARVDFVVNVVQTGDGRLVRAFSGAPASVHAKAVELARTIFEVPVAREADVVVSSPGYPKSRTLYHSGRAFNNVLFGRRPVVKVGGTVIIPAKCQDGYGHEDGPAALARFRDAGPDALIEWTRSLRASSPGHLFAYRVAHAVKRAKIVLTDCSLDAADLAGMWIEKATSLQEAFDREIGLRKDPFVLVLPFGTITLPVIGDRPSADAATSRRGAEHAFSPVRGSLPASCDKPAKLTGDATHPRQT